MTLTDELKILDDKIKANQAQYDLGREAAKISALSSKDLQEKYEYLTGKDLLNLSILHWTCHLVYHLKKIILKTLRRTRVILIMTTDTAFTNGMMNFRRCH